MTVEERNLSVIRRWLEAWNRHDVDAAVALCAEDMVNHGRKVGRKGAAFVMRDILTTFPDQTITVENMVATGDAVIFRATVTATHLGTGRLPVDGGLLMGVPPTGKRYSNQHIHWFTLREGEILEHRANRDDIGMMVQLGLLPPPPPFPG
ncbi:MAG TPA: ester cyclase [Myxococcota bacterium]|nr:ester cyclase [Myxococcota bacterium]